MTVTQTARGRTRTPKSTTSADEKTAEQKTEEQKPSEQKTTDRSLTLNLPMLTVQVRPPDVHLPQIHLPHVNRQEVGQAVDAARSFLPPPERIAYYGGLGALAVAGLLEWPVAAAIGIGTIIAQRARRQDEPATPDPKARGAAGRRTEGAVVPKNTPK